jgi:adenosylcobinamide-phosphate synthase
MTLLSLLFALLIEQVRPLKDRNWVQSECARWAQWFCRHLDVGQSHHARLIWCLSVGAPSLLVLLMHWFLWWSLGWVVAMLWSVLVLYATLGFRQFSHHFTEIRDALEAGDDALARQKLALWQRADTSHLSKPEVIRLAIEYSVLAAHQHVFGVLFWFSIFASVGLGPMGAVVYRMSHLLARLWSHPNSEGVTWGAPMTAGAPGAHGDHGASSVSSLLGLATTIPLEDDVARAEHLDAHFVSEALRLWSAWAWMRLDWLSARATALSFAVVGNFEDAIENWRMRSGADPDDNDGVVVAATAGALGLQLGGANVAEFSGSITNADLGAEPQVHHLNSVVGLVWRTVVMWFVLLTLLSLARLLG